MLKLHWNISIITKARKIKDKPNLEFLLELLLDERDKNLSKSYLKFVKFDVVKTFEITLSRTIICAI
ncbi:hypothetical protein FACS1894219_05650 [Clostridia bacterium]|nr:hypothetical protein FACS1894219_05650 [Clostridia bacterium]